MERPVGALRVAGWLVILAIGVTACSRDKVCAVPKLNVEPQQVQPGTEVTISAVGLGPCLDTGRNPDEQPTSLIPERISQLHIGIAQGQPPTSVEVPDDKVVMRDWVIAVIDRERGTLRTTGPFPSTLQPGTYYVFAQEVPLIRSNPFTVG
jgi:hypothetical protein